jgi:hypothetical protein
MSALCRDGGEVTGCSWVQVLPFQVQVLPFQVQVPPKKPPAVPILLLPPNSSSWPVAAIRAWKWLSLPSAGWNRM